MRDASYGTKYQHFKLIRNNTVMIIAHRMSTVATADNTKLQKSGTVPFPDFLLLM
ncbi:MAG: hypothetical protein J6B69_03605 [Lachnospiraceae bacterium]|nr:hypothetical protein [Lachnospiraceae bacterium]